MQHTSVPPLAPRKQVLPSKHAPVYRAHGKFQFVNGYKIQSCDSGIRLGAGIEATAYLKKGTINGHPLAYISKMWSIWSEWDGFWVEPFLYANSKHLRPLQGDVVPYFIGIYDAPGGCVSFAMDLPHPVRWREADPTISQHLKEKIIHAFEKIHARGVLHGDPALRHMLIGDDDKITIIDFGRAKCLEPNDDIGLQQCSQVDLELEIRAVKFILDYNGAKAAEYERLERKEATDGRNSKRRDILCTANYIKEEAVRLTYLQHQLELHGLGSWSQESYTEDEKEIPAFRRDSITEWDVEKGRPGHRGTHFEVPTSHRVHAIDTCKPKAELILPEVNSSPFLPEAPTTPTANTASSSYKGKQKRTRDEDNEDDTASDSSPSKKAKAIVKFHPDTADNWSWADRQAQPRPRPPTPKPLDDGLRAASPVVAPSQMYAKAGWNRLSILDSALADGWTCSSTKAEFDPLSPRPTLLDVEIPRESPPPELRELAYRCSSLPDVSNAPDPSVSSNASSRSPDIAKPSSSTTVHSSSEPRFTLPPPSLVSHTYLTHAADTAKNGVLPKSARPSPAVPDSPPLPATNVKPRTFTAPTSLRHPLTADQIAYLSQYIKGKLDIQTGLMMEQLIHAQNQRAWDAGFDIGLKTQRLQHAGSLAWPSRTVVAPSERVAAWISKDNSSVKNRSLKEESKAIKPEPVEGFIGSNGPILVRRERVKTL